MRKNNKDPDFALKLEKAISERYGAETIVNPSSKWTKEKEKKYLKDLEFFYSKDNMREKRKEHKGFLVSEKLFNKESDMFCDVCEAYSPKFENKIYFLKFECCYKCYIKFVENREVRWKSGWRPKEEK